MKKHICMWLLLCLLAATFTGCTANDSTAENGAEETITGSAGASDVNNTASQTPTPSPSIGGGAGERYVPENIAEAIECPEGYVYDYQVREASMPVEIADLGGNCRGAIHAFPSQIGMALTELDIEEDPVLKAEVEKRIPEVEATLEAEIGGDFSVDGVVVSNDFIWQFFCTEVETGYQFDLLYSNYEYLAAVNNQVATGNWLLVEGYYDEKDSIELREALLPRIQKVYDTGDIFVRMQSGVLIEVVISQYTDGDVDKCAEQKKLLALWDILKEYNASMFYNVGLTFYPPEYQDVIKEKNTSPYRYDTISTIFSYDSMSNLIENGDVKCSLNYSSLGNSEEYATLDEMLKQYKDSEYDSSTIWAYWVQ